MIYAVHVVVLPLLLTGLVRSLKARLQNRRGPSLLQPFYDLLKLTRKDQAVSETTTWVFRAAPAVQLACLVAVALMVPWLGLDAPLPGDLLLVVYLIALSKFATGLAAMDSGSAFGALGASREATVSVQAEPALVLGLATLAAHAHSTDLSRMLSPGPGLPLYMLVPPVAVALVLAALAELARMPVDDPTTHLELTMIHEALILEASGRSLALVEYAVALKTAVLLGLLGRVLELLLPPHGQLVGYGVTLLAMLCAAVALALAESTLVKLRWRRIPGFLSFGLAAATLACLLVALGG